MSKTGAIHKLLLRCSIICLAAAAYFYLPGVRIFCTTALWFLKHRELDSLHAFILDYGIWAPAAAIALMALQSLVPVVPGLIVTIVNSWLFGWQYGACYSWCGALLGALLDFLLARFCGRSIVELFISPHFLLWGNRFFAQHGTVAILISRIIPFIPFKVISYSAGFTAISWRGFLLATAIGQTPGIILYSLLGSKLFVDTGTAAAITGGLVLLGLAAWVGHGRIERFLGI